MSLFDDRAPVFVQIAERLTDQIADGALAEGDRVPSSYELAAFHRINPATAAKGLNVLITDGLLQKRRGIGMFVAKGARERLLNTRRTRFAERYVEPMIIEAARLGIDLDALLALIRQTGQPAHIDADG